MIYFNELETYKICAVMFFIELISQQDCKLKKCLRKHYNNLKCRSPSVIIVGKIPLHITTHLRGKITEILQYSTGPNDLRKGISCFELFFFSISNVRKPKHPYDLFEKRTYNNQV